MYSGLVQRTVLSLTNIRERNDRSSHFSGACRSLHYVNSFFRPHIIEYYRRPSHIPDPCQYSYSHINSIVINRARELKVIEQLKVSSSSGCDQITYNILINTKKHIHFPLWQIQSLKLSDISCDYTIANVIPVHKRVAAS